MQGETPSSGSHALPSSENRFVPGAIVAGRYRIVGLVGRGGMGEVYRADDLKLGQPVALKFLMGSVAGNEDHLARFLEEVRLARQVSHPSVCRVHDVSEVDGQHYLSMEYIDGEDLSSLLRRIGRLPQDKATEMARQLCAGLAAAHEQGILHRDLKPANVMIDGRGQVRITDFGLATFAEHLGDDRKAVGTPAYMAPELVLNEGGPSVRTDLYSLGLVLYELFTGRRAFEAKTFGALIVAHKEESTPAPVGDLIEDVDPVVDRAIMQCLERNPALRPASAKGVALALPGGDPLAAAIAAGETPSPELVAAAGGTGSMRRGPGAALLAGIVALVVLVTLADRSMKLSGLVDLPLAPAVLEHRAREIVAQLGYPDPPADSKYYFGNGNVLRLIEDGDASPGRWERIRHPAALAIYFLYRQSPYALVAGHDTWSRVWDDEPRSNVAGMVKVMMTADGKLLRLHAVPPSSLPAGGTAVGFEWGLAFAAAGLDREQFRSVEPLLTPSVACDERWAWLGPHPELPEVELRIEAASFLGKPVAFVAQRRWSLPYDLDSDSRSIASSVYEWATLAVFLVTLIGGAWFGWRNLASRRGDRKGATRVALYLLAMFVLVWLLWADHVADVGHETDIFQRAFSWALYRVAFAWILYIAAEPIVRQVWPHKLVSWNRMVQGRLGDPLVGRDLLTGMFCGAFFVAVERLHYLAATWFGAPPPRPFDVDLDYLLSGRHVLADILWEQTDAGLAAIISLFMFAVLKLLFRRTSVALVALFLVGMVRMPFEVVSTLPAVDLLFRALGLGIFFWVLVRCGALALIVAIFAMNALDDSAISFDAGAFYTGNSVLFLVLFLGLAVYSFVTATKGPPLAEAEGSGG